MASPRQSRLVGLVVSVVLIGATLSPVLRAPTHDGFPLSTYPMFAAKRSTLLTLAYGVGVRADGSQFYLPSEVTGTAEVLQAIVVYDDAVRHGAKALAALCTSILAQVDDAKTVRIIKGTVDAVKLLDERGLPPRGSAAERGVVDGIRGTEHELWSCSK